MDYLNTLLSTEVFGGLTHAGAFLFGAAFGFIIGEGGK